MLYSPPETIPYTTNSLNETRVRRVLLELLAQPAHVHIDSTGVADIIIAPDVLEQLIASQHGSTVAYEVGQQIKLFGLQFHLLTTAEDAPPSKVNAQRTGYQFTTRASDLGGCLLSSTLFTRGGVIGAAQ